MLATESAQSTKRPKTKSPYRSPWVIGSMSIPKNVWPPTTVKPSAPTQRVFVKTIALTLIASPSVTTARLMPRVRSAGIAKSRPIGIVHTTAARTASSNGQPRSATRRALINAASPASANWASESWPV